MNSQRGRASPAVAAPGTAKFVAIGTSLAVLIGCSEGSGGADAGTLADGGATLPSKCGSGAAGPGIDRNAKLEVRAGAKVRAHDETVDIGGGSLGAGKTTDIEIDILNVANASGAKELIITGLELAFTPPPTAADAGNPFTCLAIVDGAEVACDKMTWPSLIPPGFDPDCATGKKKAAQQQIRVRFKKPVDAAPRAVTLVLNTAGDKAFTTGGQNPQPLPFRLRLVTATGSPKLALLPAELDFGTVKVNDSRPEPFKIQNQGDADLVVTRIELAKNDQKPWSLELEGKTYKGGAAVDLEPKITIAKDKSVSGKVIFSAVDPSPHLTTLDVFSADQQKKTITLKANQNAACLKVTPSPELNFGFQAVGKPATRDVTLKNCGSSEAEVSSLLVADDAGGVFAVVTDGIAALGGKKVAPDNPIRIKVNGSEIVKLVATPESENKDADGKQQPYTGALKIADNSVLPDKQVKLRVWGTATACPTPIITVVEGEEVVPQTVIHLKADQSFAAAGHQIKSFQWKLLKAPDGAEGLGFFPNASVANVEFGAKTTVKKPGQPPTEQVQVNVAGVYRFQLNVIDDADKSSCQVAQQDLLVVPIGGIHVELLWDTPGDADKTDTGLHKGSDHDLHFVHAKAALGKVCKDPPEQCAGKPCVCAQDFDKDGKPDPWFHPQYDTYWYNATPIWGSAVDPDTNPGLDLDDTDGWGPENLNLKTPEAGVTYGIGVHAWDAEGFGPSTATVRIYIHSQLVATLTTKMNECDMWWTKRIEWPAGSLVEFDGVTGNNGKVTPAYNAKFSAVLGGKCK